LIGRATAVLKWTAAVLHRLMDQLEEMMDQFEEMKARNQVAFDAGKHARGEDKTLDDNPHPPRSVERRKWYEGWCEANLIRFLAQHRPHF
jgi:hypothetical protein